MTILKQAEAGVPVPELCREHGMVMRHFILQMAQQIQRYGYIDDSAAQSA
ncbi:hypothetical protein SAMN05216326_1502 [Nitrosomonas marina]|uniref:Transposase n=1 Tax=Nitrosomonas marina TaxID=917 RepID=A0A1I0G357_9PROT|nr:hypothetical protein SAMN05216326_1502 [Nitrosomonas marina]